MARGESRELVGILRRRVELAATVADRKRHLVRLASLHERELSSPPER